MNTNPFIDEQGVVAPVVSLTLAFAQAKDKLAAAKEAAVAAVKEAGLDKDKKALKAFRRALVEVGIDRRRVSEILLDLGIRERAAAKSKAVEVSDEVIAALVSAGVELAGDAAAVALRKAASKAVADAKAEAEAE